MGTWGTCGGSIVPPLWMDSQPKLKERVASKSRAFLILPTPAVGALSTVVMEGFGFHLGVLPIGDRILSRFLCLLRASLHCACSAHSALSFFACSPASPLVTRTLAQLLKGAVQNKTGAKAGTPGLRALGLYRTMRAIPI